MALVKKYSSKSNYHLSWISNYISMKIWNAISNACLEKDKKENGGLIKPR